MRSFIYSFLALAFLLSTLATPTVTFSNPDRDQSPAAAAASKAAAKARAKEIIQKRQTTNADILRRRHARHVMEVVKRTKCTPVSYPKTSGRVYPTCPGSMGTGYAKYPGWDLARNDLAGNPVYPSDKTEKGCINACNNYANNDDQTCIGGTWYAPQVVCYLKNARLCEGQWGLKSGASTDLMGGCAAWSGLVPADVDASCCNN